MVLELGYTLPFIKKTSISRAVLHTLLTEVDERYIFNRPCKIK